MSTTGAAAAMAVRTERVKSWKFMFGLDDKSSISIGLGE